MVIVIPQKNMPMDTNDVFEQQTRNRLCALPYYHIVVTFRAANGECLRDLFKDGVCVFRLSRLNVVLSDFTL